jgi:DNA-binding protein HU-beta
VSSRVRRPGHTKADLITAVHARHGGLSRAEAAAAVDAMFRAVKQTLVEGRAVRLEDFGMFELTDRPGRRGVHPADGSEVEIPGRRGVAFRPARRVRETVAQETDAQRRDRRDRSTE